MSPRPKHLIFAALVAAALTASVAGCGPDKSGQPAAQGKAAQTATAADQSPAPLATETGPGTVANGGACNLLTPAAVTAAVGAPMQQIQASAALCVYDLTSDASQQVLVHIFSDRAELDTFAALIESASTHIDGVGDDAFYSVIGGVVFVRTGDRGFTITSEAIADKYLTDPDGAKTPFVTLATLALSNFS